jgi:hypothetical protein
MAFPPLCVQNLVYYGVMASQWRKLADEAGKTDKKPPLEKIHQAHLLRGIDKAESAIRELVALAQSES